MERYKVIGLTWFNDEVQGKKINSGKVVVELPMDDRNNTPRLGKRGVNTAVYSLPGASEEALAMSHIPVPFEADLDIQRFSVPGKAPKEVLVGIKPVSLSKPAPVKAA